MSNEYENSIRLSFIR